MQSYHIDDKVNNYLKLNDNNTADLPENCTILYLTVNIVMKKTPLFIVPNVAPVHHCALYFLPL